MFKPTLSLTPPCEARVVSGLRTLPGIGAVEVRPKVGLKINASGRPWFRPYRRR